MSVRATCPERAPASRRVAIHTVARAQVRIVTRAVPVPGTQVARRRRWVKHQQPGGRVVSWPGRERLGWGARFRDDRDLTGLKLALVGTVLLIVMALEVPW